MIETAGLRKFGFTLAFFFVVFGQVIPLLRHHAVPFWPLGLASVFLCMAGFWPKTLQPVRAVWLKVGDYLGALTSRLWLGLLYIVAITPMAVIRRVFAEDKMKRKWQPELSTYREERVDPPPAKQLERIF